MKFSIIIPALFAALATSASAAFEFSDAESCNYSANLLICSYKTGTSETECTAKTECQWVAESSVCTINTADALKYANDKEAAEIVLFNSTALADCTPKAKADCTGDCSWATIEDDDSSALVEMCVTSVAKANALYAEEDVPKAIAAEMEEFVWERINCYPKADESACNAVAGCEWNADNTPKCESTFEKGFTAAKDVCGSDGDFAAAAAVTGISSGASDTASCLAVLTATAAATATLLA